MRVHPNFWCMVLYITVLSFLSSFLRCSYFHFHLHYASFSLPSSLPLPKIYIRKKSDLTSLQYSATTTCVFCVFVCFLFYSLSLPYSIVFIFIFVSTLPLSSLRPSSLSKNVTCTNTQVSPVLQTFSPQQHFFFLTRGPGA